MSKAGGESAALGLHVMKPRTRNFLANDRLPHGSEQFDYVRELHEVLWRFVRAQYPGASGSLTEWIPVALAKAEASVTPTPSAERRQDNAN